MSRGPDARFRYAEAGPVGLKGKKVFVVTARGGVYSDGGPAGSLDFQEPYLRAILGFMGIDDVTFVHLEGLKISAEVAAKGFDRARADIDRLVQDRALAVA